MKKKLIAYCGKLGSGKAYCMMKQVEELKTTGNSIYLTSFADPLKQILRNSFGITKEGIVECKVHPEQMSDLYIKAQIVDAINDAIHTLKIYLLDSEAFAKYGEMKDGEIKTIIANNYDKHPMFPVHVKKAAGGLDNNYAHHYRRCAQLLGTELGRHVLDSIWVDLALYRVAKAFNDGFTDYAFIDDCRFVNEFEAVIGFGKSKRYDADVIGVYASDETRARRRNLTMEALQAEGSHGSETEIDKILDFLYPNNVIHNEG